MAPTLLKFPVRSISVPAESSYGHATVNPHVGEATTEKTPHYVEITGQVFDTSIRYCCCTTVLPFPAAQRTAQIGVRARQSRLVLQVNTVMVVRALEV